MEPKGIILVNPPITTFQQRLTHSAMFQETQMNQILMRISIRTIVTMLHLKCAARTSIKLVKM